MIPCVEAKQEDRKEEIDNSSLLFFSFLLSFFSFPSSFATAQPPRRFLLADVIIELLSSRPSHFTGWREPRQNMFLERCCGRIDQYSPCFRVDVAFSSFFFCPIHNSSRSAARGE